MLSPLSAVKIQIDPNPLFSEEGKGEERRNRKEGRKRLLLLSKIVIVMRPPFLLPSFLPFPFWFSAR